MRGSLWREKFIIRKCVILIDCRVGYDSQHLFRKNILNSIYLKEKFAAREVYKSGSAFQRKIA